MTLRRAPRLAAVVLLGALALAGPPARADQNGTWSWSDISVERAGSVIRVTGFVTSTSSTPSFSNYRIQGVTISYEPDGGAYEGCPGGGATPVSGGSTPQGPDTDQYGFIFEVRPVCNGTWDFALSASAQRGSDATLSRDTHYEDAQPVALPAPPVESVVAEATSSGRAVDVSWEPPAAYADGGPPDFVGFRVQRVDDAVDVDDVGPEATTATDVSPPSAGGEFTYEVVVLRTGASSDELVESAAVSSDAVTVAAAPTPTTAPPTGTGSTLPGASTGDLPSRSTFPSRSPAPQADPYRILGFVTPGVEEEVPGADAVPEPGAPEPVLPDDELATDGAVLQQFVEDDDGGSPLGDRTVVVPIAGGIVLLSWALHLRYIARQASLIAATATPRR
jgi:hypothetical protein